MQRDVSLEFVRSELENTPPVLRNLGLSLDTSMLSVDDLRLRVSGKSRVDQEMYIVQFQFDDYREMPPLVDMVDPITGELGTHHAYADCFHNKACICARFSRRAYRGYAGIHKEWAFGEWAQEGCTDHLAGMISYIFSRIHGYAGSQYSGRLA